MSDLSEGRGDCCFSISAREWACPRAGGHLACVPTGRLRCYGNLGSDYCGCGAGACGVFADFIIGTYCADAVFC